MKILRNKLKKPLNIVFLVLLVLFCLTGCGERQENKMTCRQKGISYMENGKYEEALTEFQNALDLSLGEIGEEEVDICFYKAESLYRLGRIEEALGVYSAILDYEDNAKAYFLRGNLYYSLGEEVKALNDYSEALKKDKKNYDLYIGVFEALTAHDRGKEAQEYLNQALEIGGDTAYDKMQKGRIYFLLGESYTALSLLEEAIKGKETDAYYYLAEIQELLGDTKAAEESIASYVDGDKLDSYKLFQVANDQLGKGNVNVALECVEKALALENVPNKQILMKTQVICYEQKGDFATAKKLIKEYVETYPEDEEALREYTFLESR